METVKKKDRVALAVLALLVLVVAESPQAPSLKAVTHASIFEVGDRRFLFCKGYNIPEPIKWFNPKNEEIGSRYENPRVTVERRADDSLTEVLTPVVIQSLQKEDSGKWTCKSGDLNDTIEIIVGVRVNFTVTNESKTEDEGKSVTLECIAKGDPKPAVQWEKDYVILDVEKQSQKYSYKFNERRDMYNLEIRDLEHSDAGMYTCKVLQRELSYFTNKNIHLKVNHKPLVFNDTTQEVMPFKLMRIVETYAVLNETKGLECKITAHPPPQYTWRRDIHGFADSLPETWISFDSTTGWSTLSVPMYNNSFFGKYRCQANNAQGTTTVVFHLTEGSKPNPPDFVSVVNSSVDTLVFNVNCSSCNIGLDEDTANDPNNLKILGYTFQFEPVREGYEQPAWEEPVEIFVPITDPYDTVFAVGPVQNSTTFHVRVRSKNEASSSDWYDLPEHPFTTDHAITLTVSMLTLLAAILSCLASNTF